MDRRNIVSGVSALQGIQKLQSRPCTDAELKHAAQFLTGSVTPAAGHPSDDEYQLTLPFPPSMNAYWRSSINPKCIADAFHAYKSGGVSAAMRKLLSGIFVRVSEKGTDYQNMVKSLVAIRWNRPPIDFDIAMLIEAWAPSTQYSKGSRWYWDVDNRVKPLQDALAKSGVIVNDNQVRDSRIVDRGVDPPGRVLVSIRKFRGY